MNTKQKNIDLIKNLEPQKIFEHFANLTAIPRPSGHEEMIREYIIEIAYRNNLKSVVDKAGNLVVYKSKQNSKSNKTIVLQDHMDMVTEKEIDKEFDFLKDTLELIIEDDFLKADKTTLGADNGIGLCMQLALMEDKVASHPNLEFLFTTDEEVGLNGAFGLEVENIHGDYLLNLDTEEEGTVYIGCAGGQDIILEWNLKKQEKKGKGFLIEVGGFQGGHSGFEINFGRLNSIKILAEILSILNIKNINFNIVEIEGGNKRNAIPRNAKLKIFVDETDYIEVKQILEYKVQQMIDFSQVVEKDAYIKLDEIEISDKVVDTEESKKIIYTLNAIHAGVVEMSHAVKGLTETSNNLGVINLVDDLLTIVVMFRSMNDEKVSQFANQILGLFKLLQSATNSINIVESNKYPAWKPETDNELLEKFLAVYKNYTGKDADVMAVHGGLETAYFVSSMPNTKLISFGPTILNAHSPSEKVSISSVKSTYELLLKLMEEL